MNNLAFQEEVWEEMLDGKIIAMSPRSAINHNIVTLNIARIFGNFLVGKSCTVFKKELYEKCGVKEYWLVDTDSRSIETHLFKRWKI